MAATAMAIAALQQRRFEQLAPAIGNGRVPPPLLGLPLIMAPPPSSIVSSAAAIGGAQPPIFAPPRPMSGASIFPPLLQQQAAFIRAYQQQQQLGVIFAKLADFQAEMRKSTAAVRNFSVVAKVFRLLVLGQTANDCDVDDHDAQIRL